MINKGSFDLYISYMSAKYTRLGQLKGKFGVTAKEYLTARNFAGNFTYEIRSTCLSIVTYFSHPRGSGSIPGVGTTIFYLDKKRP